MGVRAAAWNMASQGCCQGQFVGRCSRSRRARLAIRAGMLISWARMVAGRARACRTEAKVAAARVRLYAIAASTVQAPLAQKSPEGACAKGACLEVGDDLPDVM